MPARRTARRLPRFTSAEIRLTLLAGLFIGILATLIAPDWSASPVTDLKPVSTPAAPVDPYAEARRSRLILEGQESPVTSEAGGGDHEGIREAGPLHVIDGDTFDYRGMRVRIADIDTPEVNGRCRYEIALADRATRRMRALLTQGPFELHALGNGRDTDQYGRKLRIVTRNGRSLGDVLVAEGLARTWSGRREPWC